jgi:hypothetical protein
MANNWQSYYPRWDKPNDPNLRRLVQQYCDQLFPDCYDSELGTLDFGTRHERLRGEVAPITDEERRSSPAIRYFEERNPEWRRGVELPCIGEISIKMLIPYLRKEFVKSLNARPQPRGYVQATNAATGMTVPPPPRRVANEEASTPQGSDPWRDEAGTRASHGDA